MEDSTETKELSTMGKAPTDEDDDDDEEYRQYYFTSMGLTLIANLFFPFIWVMGFFEWHLRHDTGTLAYERYDNPWYGGAMRMSELLAKVAVVLTGILLIALVVGVLFIAL